MKGLRVWGARIAVTSIVVDVGLALLLLFVVVDLIDMSTG